MRAVPAITSSTPRTGPADGTSASDSGVVFCAMLRMRPSASDENHIERDVGIAHPELHRLLGLKIEQHAVAFRQRLAEHQAARALGIVGGKLDREGMDAGTGHDLDGILRGRTGRRLSHRQRATGDKHDRGKTGGQNDPRRAKDGA